MEMLNNEDIGGSMEMTYEECRAMDTGYIPKQEGGTKMEEENAKLDEICIGEDKPQIEPKRVLIEDYRIEDVKTKAGKEIGKKLILVTQHPDITDRKIEVSGTKYLVGEKVKESGLWINRDSEGKIPYRSAVACMLRFLKKLTIAELKGEQVDTAIAENGYLLIKAY